MKIRAWSKEKKNVYQYQSPPVSKKAMQWGKTWLVRMKLHFFAVEAYVTGGIHNQAQKKIRKMPSGRYLYQNLRFQFSVGLTRRNSKRIDPFPFSNRTRNRTRTAAEVAFLTTRCFRVPSIGGPKPQKLAEMKFWDFSRRSRDKTWSDKLGRIWGEILVGRSAQHMKHENAQKFSSKISPNFSHDS